MNLINSILVKVPALDGPRDLERIVGNAMSFGDWLNCELHFLCEPDDACAIESSVAKFERKLSADFSTLVIHMPDAKARNPVLEIISKFDCELLLLQIGEAFHESSGDEFQELLERSPIPILVLPKRYSFQSTPPESFLVPLSGEEVRSPSLEFALKTADQTNSQVELLHVMLSGHPCGPCGDLETLGDQPHHEYQEVIDKVAAEASPYSTPEERARIRRLHHCVGFTSEEILRRLRILRGAILVLEWKGSLAEGHARTIKSILTRTSNPVLLTRTRYEQLSKLRVGANLQPNP